MIRNQVNDFRGFTLMELMVVVGIIGILSAVAVPVVSATVHRYQLRSEARQLLINFKKAKLEAVKRNRDVVIQFSGVGSQNASYLIFVNADGDSARSFNQAVDTVLARQSLRSNMTIATASFNFLGTGGSPSTGFNSRGMPLGSEANPLWGTGSCRLASTIDTTARSYTFRMSQAGNVRLQ